MEDKVKLDDVAPEDGRHLLSRRVVIASIRHDGGMDKDRTIQASRQSDIVMARGEQKEFRV